MTPTDEHDTDALLATLPARISDIVGHWAARAPQAPALHEDGCAWNYGQLAEAVDAGARMLREHGVRAGDRVMLVGENCLAQVALMFATARLDAWIVCANARLTGPEIDHIRAHCGARRVLYTVAGSPEAAAHGARHGATALPGTLPGQTLATALPATLPGLILISPLNDTCQPEPVDAAGADQVAALIYTTGTTGQSKGVMLSHRNLLFVAAASSAVRALAPRDRAYGVLPISHVFGLASVMLATLYAGACLRLAPRFSVAALLAALDGDDGLTVLQGVPAMYARLLAARAGQAAPLANRLRFAYAGGSPLDPALKQAAATLLGVPLHNGYGMTESSPTISQTRLDAPRADTSVGHPLPGVQLMVVGRDGESLAAGSIGALWVRGPNVMRGYYRAAALTAAALRPDGWLDTGDLARLDADGALFIVGRAKDLIIRSGFNVYPLEIEALLNAHPGVTQSAVVGRAVDAGEEEVLAFIETDPRQPAAPQQLHTYLAQSLAPYKRPAEIIVMAALPAAATGKILKARLRVLAREMRGADRTHDRNEH